MSEVVKLSRFGLHNRKRTIEEFEALGNAEWIREWRARREQQPWDKNVKVEKKYIYPLEDAPSALTVTQINKILRDMEDRLILLEESTASVGERSVKLMEKIVRRIGKNESKITELSKQLGVETE